MREKYAVMFDTSQQKELLELFTFTSAKELLASELVNKYR